jgi:ribA/ribD-fused uncharacterized protein
MGASHRLDTASQVFFYMDEFYCLSNFAAFRLWWRGHDFDTAEHAYQWEKFQGQGQDALQDAIRAARSAHDAFTLARTQAALVRPGWAHLRVPVMRGILEAKYQQHAYVRKKVHDSGTRELIEDSWRDGFWGWGPTRDGVNMLGMLWMAIRDHPPVLVTPPEARTVGGAA